VENERDVSHLADEELGLSPRESRFHTARSESSFNSTQNWNRFHTGSVDSLPPLRSREFNSY
jgi:hypothetical protein